MAVAGLAAAIQTTIDQFRAVSETEVCPEQKMILLVCDNSKNTSLMYFVKISDEKSS